MAVGGNKTTAFCVAWQMLAEDGEYLRSIGYEGDPEDITLCAPDRARSKIDTKDIADDLKRVVAKERRVRD